MVTPVDSRRYPAALETPPLQVAANMNCLCGVPLPPPLPPLVTGGGCPCARSPPKPARPQPPIPSHLDGGC